MKVAVIGSGVIGTSLAQELADKGVQVEVYEDKYIGYGSTSRSISALSVQQKHEVLVKLALESVEMAKKLDRRLKEEANFPLGVYGEQSPHVSVAFTEREFDEIDKYVSMWRSLGVDVKEMSPKGVKEELLPWVDENSFYRALVTYNDYKVFTFPFTLGRIALLRMHGGSIYKYRGVESFETSNGRIKAAITRDGRRVEADVFVVAAGAKSRDLAAKLEDNVKPIRVTVAGGFCTEPYKYQLKPVVTVESKGYRLTQTLRNEFAAVIYDMGVSNDNYDIEESLRVLERIATVTVKLFPSFAYVNVLRQWGAYLDYTDDGLPMVGWSGKYENLYYIYGFNNYGFSVGTAAAARAAAEIADGTKDQLLEAFRPSRE